MKKNTKTVLLILACAAVVAASTAALTACKGQSADTPGKASSDVSDNVQIPNPWTSYASLSEAVKGSGIAIEVPETAGQTKADFWQAINGEIIEVRYGDTVSIRKGIGSNDVSGDYNSYSETNDRDVDGRTVTFKGNDGKVLLAVWTDGTYSYAVSAADGMSADDMSALVAAVK